MACSLQLSSIFVEISEMCRMIAYALVVFAFFGCNDHSDNQVNLPEKDSIRKSIPVHSPLDNLFQAYSGITEALVNWDSAAVKVKAMELRKQLDSTAKELTSEHPVQEQEIKNLFIRAKRNVTELEKQHTISQQRHAFDSLSKNFYSILKSLPEKSPAIYLQVCPMAFNEVDSGYWLSKTNNIRNPYMGLHHPYYHGGMLECGETLDSINQSK